jgi:hypothetical protein
VFGLNEAAAIMSDLRADLAASNPLESEILERPMLVNTNKGSGGEGGIRTLPTQEISIDIGRT